MQRKLAFRPRSAKNKKDARDKCRIIPLTKRKKMKKVMGVMGHVMAQDADYQHLQYCQIDDCLQCKFAVVKHAWKKRLPLVTPDMNITRSCVDGSKKHLIAESWCVSGTDENGCFKLVCICCQDGPMETRFYSNTNSMNISNMLRHHKSQWHKAHAKVFLGINIGPRGLPIGQAPSKDAYSKLWDAAQSGSLTKGLAEVGSAEKCAKMRGTKSEAISVLDRRFMKTARRLSVSRDASDGVLLSHAIAATPELKRRSMLFGLSKHCGSTAEDITAATVNQFKGFATSKRFLLPQKRKCSIEVKFDEELDEHTRRSLCHVAVDSASDELLSCAMMQSMTDVFDNIETIARDKPHGNRRILSRPWSADPYMDDLNTRLFMSRHNITQRIEHSHLFKDIFEKECEKQDVRLKHAARNLRASKHKYESLSKPRGRFTLWRDAYISTAEKIHVTRCGKQEGKDAADFIKKLDDESILQTAMCADAGDEAMGLLRFTDTEDYDKSVAHTEVARFLEATIALFLCLKECAWGAYVPACSRNALRSVKTDYKCLLMLPFRLRKTRT